MVGFFSQSGSVSVVTENFSGCLAMRLSRVVKFAARLGAAFSKRGLAGLDDFTVQSAA